MNPANITRASAQERSQHVSVDSYVVTVDLSGIGLDGQPLPEPSETFISTSEIRFTSDGTPTKLNLIADEVHSAWLDEQELDVQAFDDNTFAVAPEPGEHLLTITAVCRYSHTGEGLHRFVDPADGRVYLYSQFESADARRMYADFEQPDLKATFQLTVIAPENWVVISNSPTPEPVELTNGNAVWEFEPTPRISTYITALVAGEYAVFPGSVASRKGEIGANILCRQSMAEFMDADRIRHTTQRGFDVFEKAFDREYPFAKYDQAFVPEYNFGAMENAGCITFRDEYLFRSRVPESAYESRDNTILHELAHMWFGDLVTMKWWDDLWLNESFAEWASHWAQAQIAREDGGTDPWVSFANARKTWAYTQDQLPTTHPIAADMVDLDAVEQNFDGITYAKGASTLKQLVAFVGEEPFFAGVREYFNDHAFGNTSLQDLLSALEKASGRDLSNFSAEWLEKTGPNTLRADFDVDAEGRFTRFDIVQSAAAEHPTLRTHRLAVGLFDLGDGRLSRSDSLEVDISGERTPIAALVGRPQPDLVLLNDRDLTYAKVRLDERSQRTLVENIDRLDDPLARALCWGSAWDMTRDGEMSQDDYIELVLRGIASEQDSTALNALRAQAATAALAYTPRERRHDTRVRLASAFARLLLQAEPGSDHQLGFANSVIQLSDTDSGAALLRAWLSGEEVPTGLTIDADMRWRIVTALARMGAIGTAEIDAEQQRDNTISGAEFAAGARAALRDADAKAAAWQRATKDASVPNATHRAICGAFNMYGQEDLLQAWVDPYFELVQAINDKADGWGTRGHAATQAALVGLFPNVVADQALLERIDALLASGGLNDSVTRVLREQRDQAARALRAQQVARG